MHASVVHVGADVAKDSIVWDFVGTSVSLPNSTAGCAKAFARLKTIGPLVHVVCEPTGGYERTLLKAAARYAQPVCLINARRVRQHARASGVEAKTDRIDARVLSDYGRAHRPCPRAVRSDERLALIELTTRREQIKAMRLAENNRLARADSAVIRASVRLMIRTFDRELANIERQMRQLVGAHPDWSAALDRLCQVKCVGWLTACTIFSLMPELGSLDDQEAAALAGVAPYNADSGRQRGHRHIGGGRTGIRGALYMAALSGIRYNRVFKTHFERLRQKGKPGKVALTAVMRKLIVLLNRLIKNPNFALAD